IVSPNQAAAYEKALATLRQHCAESEKGYRTVEAIAEYLNSLGLLNGRGKPITHRTIRHWAATRSFPLFTLNKSDGSFSTNLMILAWLWSYRGYQKDKAKTPKRNRQPRVTSEPKEGSEIPQFSKPRA